MYYNREMLRPGIIVLLSILMGLCTYAQRKDFQTWWSVEVGTELFKKIELSVSPEIRLESNSRYLRNSLIEFDARYQLHKYFHFGGMYRFELEQNDEGYTSKINRYVTYGLVRYRINRFRIRYRGAMQWEYTDYNTSEYGYIPAILHRHKLLLRYPIRKSDFIPFAAAEGFFTIKPIDKREETKLRIIVGFDYDLPKGMELQFNYKFQHEFYENNPYITSILGFKYSIDF